MEDINRLVKQRIEKFALLKQEMGVDHFPNTYKKDTDIADFIQNYGSQDPDELLAVNTEHRLAGRIMAVRSFGKASFIHFQDGSGKLQAFFEKARVSLSLGSQFGPEGDGHMRMLIATSEEIINEALDRIEKTLPGLVE